MLELLTVMAIFIIMMGMGLASFNGLSRGAALRGAITGLRTGMSAAREYAIARSRPVDVLVHSNRMEVFYLSSSGLTNWVVNTRGGSFPPRTYAAENDLPVPVEPNPLQTPLKMTLLPDGSSQVFTDIEFMIRELGGNIAYKVKVEGLTGSSQISEILAE